MLAMIHPEPAFKDNLQQLPSIEGVQRIDLVDAAGALVAVALTVPLVNIAVPLLAAAAFTHLFHLISAADGQPRRYPRD